MPSSSTKVVTSHHRRFSFFWISRHIHSAAYTVFTSVKDTRTATASLWQNNIFIWDTHKGESDLNTRQFKEKKHWTDNIICNINPNCFDNLKKKTTEISGWIYDASKPRLSAEWKFVTYGKISKGHGGYFSYNFFSLVPPGISQCSCNSHRGLVVQGVESMRKLNQSCKLQL